MENGVPRIRDAACYFLTLRYLFPLLLPHSRLPSFALFANFARTFFHLLTPVSYSILTVTIRFPGT